MLFGRTCGGVGLVRVVGMVLKGWAYRAGLTAHQQRVLFGAASRSLLSVGGRGGVSSDFNKNKKVINKSKPLKGEDTRWNSNRGFGFIRPTDGGEEIFCHFSSITDVSVLCEGDMVEYQAEYDDSKGKYRAVEVTGGIKEDRGARGGGGYGSHTDSYLLVKHSAAYFNTLMHSAAYLCVWACR